MRRIKTDLLHGVIYQQLLLFFFPVLFGTLFQQLYNTVDAVVVGNYIGKQALAAVGGSTGTIINLIQGFLIGLASGTTVAVAQYYGSQEYEKVKHAVSTGLLLAAALGIALTIGGQFLAPALLRVLNVPADILPYAVTYLRLYFLGLIPTLIYNTGSGILRAVGDSKRPLIFLIAACITNIVLDILFVMVFHMGIAGAAIATVLAQVVSCALTLFVLYHAEGAYQFRFNPKEILFDPSILKQILIIGFPTGLQSSLYAFANMFVQSRVNTFGTDTVAAYTAFGTIDMFYWNTSGALGTAVLTFSGQNFGAGNIERVRKGFHQAIFLYLGISGIIIGICSLFGSTIFSLFTRDANVITIGLSILHFMMWFWPVFCLVEVFSSGMRACGDSLVPMLMTALGIGVLRVAWILFYPAKSLFDILKVYPISWLVTSVLFLIYYLQGGWLKRSLHRRKQLLQK